MHVSQQWRETVRADLTEADAIRSACNEEVFEVERAVSLGVGTNICLRAQIILRQSIAAVCKARHQVESASAGS